MEKSVPAMLDWGNQTEKEPRKMARTPNYSFERKERERLKAAKKAEKQAAKAAAKERADTETESETETVSAQDE